MAWYNFWRKDEDIEEKLTPIQQNQGQTQETTREYTANYEQFYETLEIVNRGVNLIVDDVAEIPCTILALSGA